MKANPRQNGVWRELSVALGTGLLLASFDVLWNLRAQPRAWVRFGDLLPAFVVTLLFVTAGFLLGWFVVVRPLAGRARLALSRALVGWSAFVNVAFVLLTANQLAHLRFLTPPNTWRSLAMILVAAAVAALAGWKWERAHGSQAYLWALPWLAVEAMLFGWAAAYPEESGIGTGAAIAGFLLVGLLTLLVCRKRPAVMASTALAAGSLVLAAAGVALPLLEAGRVFLKSTPSAAPVSAPASPPVLLITVDSLRRDALSCYNAAAAPTPRIDRLAADSVLFERAYTPASWTLPAVASMLTGLPPHTHRLSGQLARLPAAFPTVAERLRDTGYRTGAVVSNPWLGPESGLTRGFSEYAWFPKPANPFVEGSLGGRFAHLLYPPPDLNSEALTDLALDWLAEHREQPYFLWVHYLDPHVPYAPPERLMPPGPAPVRIGNSFTLESRVRDGMELSPLEKRWIKSLYLAEVQWIDEQIGRLVDFLERQGEYRDMLIILTSDHGEEFWEHGGFEHGHSVFEEVIAVPLLVKLPGSTSGRSLDQPVSTGSIASWIFQAAGIPVPTEGECAPMADAPWQAVAARREPGAILSRSDLYGDPKEALIEGVYKYVHLPASDTGWGYDLAADPAETEPLPAESPEAARARERLHQIRLAQSGLRDCYRVGEDEPVQRLDPETRKRLKSLGYVR